MQRTSRYPGARLRWPKRIVLPTFLKVTWRPPTFFWPACALFIFASVILIACIYMSCWGYTSEAHNIYANAQITKEESSPSLLLLLKKMLISWGILCTLCIYYSRVIIANMPYILTAIVVPFSIHDIVHRYTTAENIRLSLRRAIYEIVVDQFADCKRCGHKENCPKSSPEKLSEVVSRCMRELGLDFFDLQREARICLRKSTKQKTRKQRSASTITIEAKVVSAK